MYEADEGLLSDAYIQWYLRSIAWHTASIPAVCQFLCDLTSDRTKSLLDR